MSIIAQTVTAVHLVQVVTPDGDPIDVTPGGGCGLRRAVLVARALSGWLAADEWEPGSAFAPLAVRRLRKKLRKYDEDLDLAACLVRVVCPAEAGPDAPNGYEDVATYRVGKVVPGVLVAIRREDGEDEWRADPPHPTPEPHARAAG